MADNNRLFSLLNFSTGDLIQPPLDQVSAVDLQTGLDLYSGIQASSRQPDTGADGGRGSVAYAATSGRLRPMGRRRGF